MFSTVKCWFFEIIEPFTVTISLFEFQLIQQTCQGDNEKYSS